MDANVYLNINKSMVIVVGHFVKKLIDRKNHAV